MQMKNLNIYFWLFFISFITACENEIPFNIKNNPPKLVINALLNSDNDENYVVLSLTGRDSVPFVNEAVIGVYVNDGLKERITERDKDRMRYVLKSKFKAGDKVKIEASTNDGKYHAWAEDVVPYPIEIERIDTMTYVVGDSWDLYNRSRYMRFKVTFTDNSLEKNYYRLIIYRKDSVSGISRYTDKDTMFISEYTSSLKTNEDIVLNEGKIPIDDDNSLVSPVENDYCIFNDSYLNGTYTMIISARISSDYFNDWWGIKDEKISTTFKIRLISITEAEYYYLRALNLYYSENYEEYLSQPISFPSNVHGGVGIVGFEIGTTQNVCLPEYYPENDWY